MKQVEQSILKAWYQGSAWIRLLAPLGWLTAWVAERRYRRYLAGDSVQYKPEKPVVVVGNITVGGTGKTPFVAALIRLLQARGLKPGIISRGYGSQSGDYPQLVSSSDDVAESGDEPLMLAQMTGVPVVVDPDRPRGLAWLLDNHDCDVVISDDGLQHYPLHRDLEIVVLDGERRLGNGYCLPAGPLRESATRLQYVDWCVMNGDVSGWEGVAVQKMTLEPGELVSLASAPGKTPTTVSTKVLQEKHRAVHAVAGIGNPGRFFSTLKSLGWHVIAHPFPDHHDYQVSDVDFNDDLPVVMTQKDAVKCQGFTVSGAAEKLWYLPVEARLDSDFTTTLTDQIVNLVRKKQSKH